MFYSLAISTSGKSGSLCVADDTKVLFSSQWTKHNSHAELINTLCLQALEHLNLSIDDISLFITDIGPGSFTGVRVGTSAIKSFAYKNKKPIAAIPSLDIIAEAFFDSKIPICVLINAQRNEFYTAFYDVGKNRIKKSLKPKLMDIQSIERLIKKKHLLLGDGADLFLKHCKESVAKKTERPAFKAYDSVDMTKSLTLGHKLLKLNKTKEWNTLDTLYIRSSSAEEKLKKGELTSVERYNRRKDQSF